MKKFILLPVVVIILVSYATSIQAQAPARKAVLNHTAIYVKDVKASATFYRSIIGLDTIPEPFHDGKHVWFRIAPGVAMHVIEGADQKKEYYKNQHTCFSVASVDAFTTLLKKNHIPWEDRDGAKLAVTTRVDGVKQIWLQDPDGYWLEINDAKE
ncbi:MAG TPA: VOC family protein [Ohtaekwangia sp.]|uniref:VOC family protein n=1 Tax=Ohtaekwangia sp. TaxID=2066019 RepID=UPI002F93EB9E